jgi:hypothetical protein
MIHTSTRDRDDVVTAIPVLIPIGKSEKRDGIVFRDDVVFASVVDNTEPSVEDTTPSDRVEQPFRLGNVEVKVLPLGGLYSLLSKGMDRKGARWQLEKQERTELIALMTLVQGVATGRRDTLDSYAAIAERLFKDLAKLRGEDPKQFIQSRLQNANETLGADLNRKLTGVRLVIWWADKQKQFVPGLLCDNLHEAFAALLASRTTASQNFAICALPSCATPFVRLKKNNRYHTRKCGDAHRQQLSRAKRRRAQKRVKRNVPRKTR